jgi:hypothetical protein
VSAKKKETPVAEVAAEEQKPQDLIDVLLTRIDDVAESGDLEPNTRAILDILRDLGFSDRNSMPAVVRASAFDEFSNRVLKDTITQIRTDCVRMDARYSFILDRLSVIKPSMRASGPVNFI